MPQASSAQEATKTFKKRIFQNNTTDPAQEHS
jgi:hypothetical protein